MAKISIDDKSPFDIENPKKPFARAKKTFLERYEERKEGKKTKSALRTHAIIAQPQELLSCDPLLAIELDANRFCIAGRFIVFDPALDTPFAFHPVSKRWETELHRFDWLRHLSAPQPEGQDTPDYSTFYAQSFTKGWLSENFEPSHVTWHHDIMSCRIINWLTHSHLILSSKKSLKKKVMRSLGEQLHSLASNYNKIPPNQSRMQAAHALLMGGLCIAGQSGLYDKFMPRYLYELTTQILPDGSHISRNPETLLHLIQSIMQIREMLQACHKSPHERIEEKLPLMLRALRFMRLGDGNLGRFNGVSQNHIEEISYCLYRDKDRLPLENELADGHYFRLEQGEAVLLADGGTAPPAHAGGQAQAGATSFEFSSEIYPIIVNCGTAPLEGEKDSLFARSTPAHSAIGLSDFSSASLQTVTLKDIPESLDILTGPPQAEGQFSSDENGQTLKLFHDGFAAVGGIGYQRILALDKTGLKLQGEERLNRINATALPKNAVVTRFHIHPANHVEQPDSQTVHITLPNQKRWIFSVRGAQITLSEDRYFGTKQSVLSPLITLDGPGDTNQVIYWELCEEDQRKKAALAGLSAKK